MSFSTRPLSPRGPNAEIAHLQLPTLENVTIRTARLSRPAADGRVQATSGELRLKEGVHLGICTNTMSVCSLQWILWQMVRTLLPLIEDALHVVRGLLRLLALRRSGILLRATLRHGLGVLRTD